MNRLRTTEMTTASASAWTISSIARHENGASGSGVITSGVGCVRYVSGAAKRTSVACRTGQTPHALRGMLQVSKEVQKVSLTIRPTREFVSLRDAIDKLFEDSFIRPAVLFDGTTVPFAVDLYETPEAYILKGALPGVKPEDISIDATVGMV